MEPVQTQVPTKSKLRRAIAEQYGSWLWGQRSRKPKAERVANVLEYRRLRSQLNAGQYVEEINARGNVVHRDIDADLLLGFVGHSSYAYDNFLLKRGWRQWETENDAGFFACYVHLEKRLTAMAAELLDMELFYGPTSGERPSLAE
jgi:hypothetical protein